MRLKCSKLCQNLCWLKWLNSNLNLISNFIPTQSHECWYLAELYGNCCKMYSSARRDQVCSTPFVGPALRLFQVIAYSKVRIMTAMHNWCITVILMRNKHYWRVLGDILQNNSYCNLDNKPEYVNYHSGAKLEKRGEESKGEASPAPFSKIVKSTLIVYNFVLNVPFEIYFYEYLGEKSAKFFLLFLCFGEKCLWKCPHIICNLTVLG